MKRILCIFMTILMVFGLVGCSSDMATYAPQPQDEVANPINYNVAFYDNYGDNWMTVVGKNFSISPNKIKEYSITTDGNIISSWAISSIMSIEVDGQMIQTCGSTVTFADSRLESIDIELPEEIMTREAETGSDASVDLMPYFNAYDYWSLNWWWDYKNLHGIDCNSRLVIIQSQNGDPIAMYTGNEVTWEACANLPKTTEIIIDGKYLYIHRANFSILDTSLLEQREGF